ncbi:hypothetical protein CCZ01_09575 [Helicobacter monodelphidis]|uniref:hypothetical protein n=1 Tax=Helicobacter sp. 15-1451 TaxID=2004995 RepID=UPI000DCC3A5F|nr:hypothetical protein [Helicobacter sp. 15-1451]RAX56411.1 hypothetical protein CCZ01_09575 [Helicobacter sp. 15-1451]
MNAKLGQICGSYNFTLTLYGTSGAIFKNMPQRSSIIQDLILDAYEDGSLDRIVKRRLGVGLETFLNEFNLNSVNLVSKVDENIVKNENKETKKITSDESNSLSLPSSIGNSSINSNSSANSKDDFNF